MVKRRGDGHNVRGTRQGQTAPRAGQRRGAGASEERGHAKQLAAPRKRAVAGYRVVLDDVVALIDAAQTAAARSVNAVITVTYWQIGRIVVEHEQKGAARAAYGETLMHRLAADLTDRYGRGFSRRNIEQMRRFYLLWPKAQTASALSRKAGGRRYKAQTASAEREAREAPQFMLPWSHYVRLLSVDNPEARAFYEAEALRGGWTVRQLDRQISTLFYERTALSKDKAAMLARGAKPKAEDTVTAEEQIKDPFVLEFLGLKDEYSESALEEALIQRLEAFLLELGDDFAFVGQQRRLRVGNAWYRVDLLFFHRRLRCLVVIDLKLGAFTHADAGQMHLYLNYAREHWSRPGENPPVGLILCAEKDAAVAKYALDALPNKILAMEYKMTLPDEKVLAREMEKTRRMLGMRAVQVDKPKKEQRKRFTDRGTP